MPLFARNEIKLFGFHSAGTINEKFKHSVPWRSPDKKNACDSTLKRIHVNRSFRRIMVSECNFRCLETKFRTEKDVPWHQLKAQLH